MDLSSCLEARLGECAAMIIHVPHLVDGQVLSLSVRMASQGWWKARTGS